MGQEPLAHYNFSTNNKKKEPTYCSNSQASTILVPQTAMRRSCTCGAGGEVPADELDAPLLVLDLERGRGQDHTVAPTMTAVPAAAMTEAVRAALLLDAQEVEVGKAAWKAIKCIFRVRPNPRSHRCGADGISSIYLNIRGKRVHSP